MEKFTHGIMVINPNMVLDNGNVVIVHFAGFWEKPNENDFEAIIDEIENNPNSDLKDMFEDLEYFEAPKEVVDHFNETLEEEGIFELFYDEIPYELLNLNNINLN